jgi:hypothetical protein
MLRRSRLGASPAGSPTLLLLVTLLGCSENEWAGSGPGPDAGSSDDSGAGDDGDDGGVGDCSALQAIATTSRSAGRVPFEATLDASGSCGPDPITSWRWTVDGESSDGAQLTWSSLSAGTYEVELLVRDSSDNEARDTLQLEVRAQECPTVLDPVELGALEDAELNEASALVVSGLDPAVIWTHNDSGDTARLFALDRQGGALGTWSLKVEPGDWEDLAWGLDPDSGAPLLFAGDIGNNDGSRESLTVYVVDEPSVDLEAAPAAHAVASWRTLTLRTSEALNFDSMFVDPQSGDLFLLSDASDGRAVLMRKAAPHLDGDDVLLQPVLELWFGGEALPGDVLATGADVTPQGERIVVRTRTEAWMWLRDGSQTVDEALAGAPCAVPLPAETLGEAIAFDTRDGGLLTTSEGVGEPLWWVPFSEPADCDDNLQATIVATPPQGPLPLTTVLDASTSCPGAGIDAYEWTVDGTVLFGESVSASWLSSGTWPVELLLTGVDGSTSSASTSIVVEPGDCPTSADTEQLATVVDSELIEISGITQSRIDPDVLWVHNDSGDSPRLFALDRSGNTLGTWTLDVSARDYEDIAAGYSVNGIPELWVGDVGDNLTARDNIEIFRIDEPTMPGGDAKEHSIDDVDVMTLTWPDGARNCETLMVDPVTRDLYLVTKDTDGDSGVYRKRAPHADGEKAELELVANLQFGVGDLAGDTLATGGEFSADGAWLVVRSYGGTSWIWRRDGASTVDEAFAGTPCPISMPSEVQGEAVCFETDGGALLTVSEGDYPPVYRIALGR